MAQLVRNLPASAGAPRDVGLIPGLGWSPGRGNVNPPQYSCLENYMDRVSWRVIQSMGLQNVGHSWAGTQSKKTLFFRKVKVLVAQLCPTLCDSMNCSPPGSTVHGIFQARILEWVDLPVSRESSWSRDRTRAPSWQEDFLSSEVPGEAL